MYHYLTYLIKTIISSNFHLLANFIRFYKLYLAIVNVNLLSISFLMVFTTQFLKLVIKYRHCFKV